MNRHEEITICAEIINNALDIRDKISDPASKNRSYLFEILCALIKKSNQLLYGSEDVEDMNADDLSFSYQEDELVSNALKRFDFWASQYLDDLTDLSGFVYADDYDYHKMMLHIRRVSKEAMLRDLICTLNRISQHNGEYYHELLDKLNKYFFFWGELEPENRNYEHFYQIVYELKDYIDFYSSFYDKLCDRRSKRVLAGIVKQWVTMDTSGLNKLRENNYDDYFDHDILSEMRADEVFVDCGAYNGDSAESFINNYLSWKRLYLYEMLPSNVEKQKKLLGNLKDVVFRNVGVTDHESAGKKIAVSEGADEAVYEQESKELLYYGLESQKTTEIELVSLDEDIDEPITILKMDIEGSELAALRGCERHIREDKPKLLICTYHKISHIREIVELISGIRSDYKFFMRYNGNEPLNSFWPSEHVLFAV